MGNDSRTKPPRSTLAAVLSVIGGLFIALAGLPFGYVVLIAGIAIRENPQNDKLWAALILGFSIIGTIRTPGGFLGIAGGIVGMVGALDSKRLRNAGQIPA